MGSSGLFKVTGAAGQSRRPRLDEMCSAYFLYTYIAFSQILSAGDMSSANVFCIFIMFFSEMWTDSKS